jgi:hypothetical protein
MTINTRGAIALLAGLALSPATHGQPADPPARLTRSAITLPALRSPAALQQRVPPPIPLDPPIPLEKVIQDLQPPHPPAPANEPAALRQAMAAEVHGVLRLSPSRIADLQTRATAMLHAAGTSIDAPQLVVVVDRNPAIQVLGLMLATPAPHQTRWSLIGAVHVSTGQANRKDYYITPIGVFRHTDAILDFRALGTYNEHHVRGLGVEGMRVWDFGWQWAVKGWHTDHEGGDIRLQMHATDPKLLEVRLGRPASEGCIRVSSTMNRFMDEHGVLDADYERAAITDIRYRALLKPERTPTPLAGRLLIVVDSRDPIDTPPTQTTRPPNWPAPLGADPQAAVQE